MCQLHIRDPFHDGVMESGARAKWSSSGAAIEPGEDGRESDVRLGALVTTWDRGGSVIDPDLKHRISRLQFPAAASAASAVSKSA